MATKNTSDNKNDRQSKAAVRRWLSAVDRLINAAKQAERARNDVERSTGGKQ